MKAKLSGYVNEVRSSSNFLRIMPEHSGIPGDGMARIFYIKNGWVWLIMLSVAILMGDFFSGRSIHFSMPYILPVVLSGWTGYVTHIPKQGGIVMKLAKIFTIILVTVAVGLFSCSKEKGTEAPQQEQVIKNLVPPKVESKGESLAVELSELQVFMTVNPVSKEMIETPKLGGRYKITNTSKNILNIQGVTLEYLDEGGKSITFASGEKIATASLYLNVLKPGETGEGSLDVTIPRAAIKELAKININVVYIPSPLKRETLTLPEKVE